MDLEKTQEPVLGDHPRKPAVLEDQESPHAGR
jgi:hypothetical protein